MSPSRHRILIAALALAAALVLGGCLETEGEGEPPERVDEEGQAIDASVQAIRDYCDTRSPSDRQLRRAERGVERFLVIARRSDDLPYEDQYEWRDALATLSTFLEDGDCLPEQVPRIDRFLRRMTLPEPVIEEEEYIEEEDYDPGPR